MKASLGFGIVLMAVFMMIMIFGMLAYILLYLIKIHESVNAVRPLDEKELKKAVSNQFLKCWLVCMSAALGLCALVMFLNVV